MALSLLAQLARLCSPRRGADAEIAALYVYPIKSCAAVSLAASDLGPAGLALDRAFVVADASTGVFLTQREHPTLALVQPTFEPGAGAMTLRHPAAPPPGLTVSLAIDAADDDESPTRPVCVWGDTVSARVVSAAADAWFSALLGRPAVLLRRDAWRCHARGDLAPTAPPHIAFPDAFPLLLVNEASVAALQARLPATRAAAPLTPLHFRPNVVLRGAPAFAEDRWAALRSVAGALLACVGPCGRCGVPSIDPATAVRAGDAQPLLLLRQWRPLRGEGCFGVHALLAAPASTVLRVGVPLFVDAWQSSPFPE